MTGGISRCAGIVSIVARFVRAVDRRGRRHNVEELPGRLGSRLWRGRISAGLSSSGLRYRLDETILGRPCYSQGYRSGRHTAGLPAGNRIGVDLGSQRISMTKTEDTMRQEKCSQNWLQYMNGESLLHSALALPMDTRSAKSFYFVQALIRASQQLCHS
jgi:hypothetical protein